MGELSSSDADGMRAVIDRWRDVALTSPGHQDAELAGHPIIWWFTPQNATTDEFMQALAGDPTLIVPGRPAESGFVTRFLRPGRPMGGRLSGDRAAIEAWISALPVPAGDPKPPVPPAPPAPEPGPAPSARTSAGPEPSGEWTYKALLPFEPEYFHRLVNIETYPEFLPLALKLARFYLKGGAAGPSDDLYNDFDYTEDAFEARIKAIYDVSAEDMYKDHWLDSGVIRIPDEAKVPKTYSVGRFSDAAVRERVFQWAPFNLTDGVWLQKVVQAAPMDQVRANLFSIWADEAGNGVVSQNHSNVFDTLLKSLNIYLPPITSRDFMEEDFLPGAFTGAVFELAIGQFPEEFLPELLGMTLYLEWDATPSMTPAVRLYEGRRINAHFYRLHAAIDNVNVGHGALARDSIKTYLADIRESGGDDLVQKHWKRIWNGYVMWARLGGFGAAFYERGLMMDRKQVNISADPAVKKCWPDSAKYYHDKMVWLVRKKMPDAIKVHGGKTLAGVALSELFKEPEKLMEALRTSGLIDKERPRDSKFLGLLTFNGPMYKVFTESEVDIILDWVESLTPVTPACYDPITAQPPPTDLPDEVAAIITAHADAASRVHDGITLATPAGAVALQELVRKPKDLMEALTRSGWIVPGEPGRSMFVTRMLANGGPMGPPIFTAAEIETWKQWIREGAKVPAQADARKARRAPSAESLVPAAAIETAVARRQLLGMGGLH